MNRIYKNFSERDKEQYRCFLLSRDGFICNICKKTIEELLKIRFDKEKKTGVRYNMPVLILEHRNNNPRQINGDNEEYCGNLQLACISCNNKKGYYQNKEKIFN